MGRPNKSASVYSGKISKEEIAARQQQEEELRGNADKIKAPTYLLPAQKRIFNNIVKELQSSNILSNLDVHILTLASTSIYYIQQIEKKMIENDDLIADKTLLTAKEKYTKEFFRCCNELCLSPQSRAKLSNINVQTKKNEDDPLLKALSGDNDD